MESLNLTFNSFDAPWGKMLESMALEGAVKGIFSKSLLQRHFKK